MVPRNNHCPTDLIFWGGGGTFSIFNVQLKIEKMFIKKIYLEFALWLSG